MIDLVNVTKTYETGTHALNGIDMHIDDGEFVFLVGPSGSGKSTIIKLLTAELKPTSGSVLVNGYQLESIKRASIPYMRRTLGVIFQDFRLIENKTDSENVAFAMRVIGAGRAGEQGPPSAERAVRRRAAACGHCPRAHQQSDDDHRR